MREYPARGNLSPALHAYVRFVATLNQEGEQAHDLPRIELKPAIRKSVTRLVRNTVVVRAVKRLYDNQCQICGARLELSSGRYYSEGHHLKALGRPHDGEDRRDNVVCVCPNWHVRLDYHAIRIDRKKFKVDKHEIAPDFIDYHNTRCR